MQAPARGTPQRPAGLPASLITLLTLATAVIALVGMYLGRDLIGPLAIAAVIVIISNPIRKPLERRGWPRWLATTAVIFLAYAILIVMALMLAYAGGEFVALAMEYSSDLRSIIDGALDSLSAYGLDSQIASATSQIFNPSALIGVATSLGTNALAILTTFFFIFAYVIFMAADAARYVHATDDYGPSAGHVMSRFEKYNTSVRRYYVVNASFGLVVAVVDGVALWLMNVPGAMVWAILAFVTNFVPNIGFILGLIPPMLMALVVGGWPLALGVLAIYCVANVVLQVLVQPKFVSDAVNLSLTLSFFSVLFWTFIIGPLGAILSIPLTLGVRSLILDGDDEKRWILWLTGDTDVDEKTPKLQAAPAQRVTSAPAAPAKTPVKSGGAKGASGKKPRRK